MDRETFLHLLKIARLDESPEEYLHHFDEILELLRRVEEIMFSEELEEESSNPLRKDVVEKSPEDLVVVFPKKKGRYLEVPKNL